MSWYNFDTVLYRFFETGTSDRTLMGLNQLLRIAYTPFHFSFTVPLKSLSNQDLMLYNCFRAGFFLQM